MKTDHPFLSIITASLDCVGTIRETIDSISKQTFPLMEHIIIDGGSTDGTLDVIKEAARHHQISYLSERDDGIADALNKGILMANGQYILVLQADDRLISRNICEKIYPVIANQAYDIVSFPVLKMNKSGNSTPFNPIKIPGWYHLKTVFPHSGAFVHKRVFKRIGGFKKEFSIAMDYDFFYRALDLTPCSVLIQTIPAAVIGCNGISSNPSYLRKRLREEHLIQKSNEKRFKWKITQWIFRQVYVPYKLASTRIKGSLF